MTIKVTFQVSSTTMERIQHDLYVYNVRTFVAQASRRKSVQHFRGELKNKTISCKNPSQLFFPQDPPTELKGTCWKATEDRTLSNLDAILQCCY